MPSVWKREENIDSVLISDFVDDVCLELDIEYSRFDFSDMCNDGSGRDTNFVTIVIPVGFHITLEGLKDCADIMGRIDKKFGDGAAYLNGAEDDLDEIEIRFDAPLKEVLGL